VAAAFSDWVEAVFDHPVTERGWYWDPQFDELWDNLGLSEQLLVGHMTSLFREPSSLRRYSLEQVAQGIWFLIGESSPAQPSGALIQSTVDIEARVACVRSMADFFRLFVAPSSPGPADTDSDPFHIACYMWWDIFPMWGGSNAGEPVLHEACLQVMTEGLALDSELCQISALHGLNHWHLHYPKYVETAVDSFLAGAGRISDKVRQYAAAAREGCAQ
jgi:hypothetical protein